MENKATKSIWAQRIPIKEQLAITKRIFRFAKHFKFEFLIAIVFSIVSSVAAIYMPRTIQFFMDQYLAHHTASSAIIWAYAGMYAALCVIVAIADFTWNYAFSLGKEKTLEAMRRSLYRKLHQLGMRYFDQTPAGSILSRVTNDTMTISDYFQVFSALFLGIISIVTATVAMYATNRAATLLVLAFIPIYVIVIAIYLSFISKIYREYRERNSLINAKLNESLTGIAVIQEFRQEKRVSESFAAINDAQLRTRNRMIRMNSFLLSPLNNLLYSVALTLVLVYFGFPLRETFVPAGIIYVFSQYVENFFNPLSNMMDSLTSFTDGIIACKRIFHNLDETEYEPLLQPVAD
ncbi:MAG: ABC transporter ATP-binding protein, partial [Lactobacillus sp.]|nr:ABC transporter ATP-binding protein [Lactobacillus sp.]